MFRRQQLNTPYGLAGLPVPLQHLCRIHWTWVGCIGMHAETHLLTQYSESPLADSIDDRWLA